MVYVPIVEQKYRAGSGFLYAVSCQENRSWSRAVQNTTQTIVYYAWASDLNLLPSQLYQVAEREGD